MDVSDDAALDDVTRPLSTRRRKKARKALRKRVGYDDSVPEECRNCLHYGREVYSTDKTEYFPPRCEKHKFEVKPFAVCRYWTDNRSAPEEEA